MILNQVSQERKKGATIKLDYEGMDYESLWKMKSINFKNEFYTWGIFMRNMLLEKKHKDS